MISKALLVLFFATVYQCYFFLGLCQSTVSENSQCLNRRDDCYKDNSCSYTFTLPRSDGENCPALRDTLMDLQRVKTRLEEQQLRLDEQEIHLEEQQLRLDGQERLLEEQQRLINKLEEKTYDYARCPIEANFTRSLESYLNLTIATSDVTPANGIFDLRGFNSGGQAYLVVVTRVEFNVYNVLFCERTLQKIQSVPSRGFSKSYGGWHIASEYFQWNRDHYFMTGTADSDYRTSKLYKWQGTDFTENRQFTYPLVPYWNGLPFSAAWSFIESKAFGKIFLANALANMEDGIFVENTFVYLYNGSEFVLLQEISLRYNVHDIKFFESSDSELYLCIGSWFAYPEQISHVYKYSADISQFVPHQTLPVTGTTSGMIVFDIVGTAYLMHTIFYSDHDSSPLYIWNTSNSTFEIHQVFNTTEGRSSCHLEYCEQHFLVIVSQHSDSIVYKLEGQHFVEYQNLHNYQGHSLYSCHAFEANGVPYIAVDRMIYTFV
ncbi:uncharacterized protein [Ptychodera flava]|uniref:uncharacterized protein isoform X1 n=1 Tax=Ptychodera flava TaxID=63121 RepID=UPI00396A7E95